MNTKSVTLSGMLAVALLLFNTAILETALLKDADWYNALWVTIPLLAVAIYHSIGKKATVTKTGADFINSKK